MARGFEFRLEPLLESRKRIEEEKRRSFAACLRALDECAREAGRLDVLRAGCRDAADLRLRDAYLRRLDGRSEALEARHCALAAELDRTQEELAAASRERRLIEKLKERRRRAFDAQEARRDALELDDANARRHERALRKRVAR
jgi:flagellar protein FliJ